ncbi:hypothetical protein [Emticicia sp. 17c]|uniref:hypothetical protein n=1 Tax=Emticicia sp. 17c TaxID=3127704 RepID=UPI00301C60B6
MPDFIHKIISKSNKSLPDITCQTIFILCFIGLPFTGISQNLHVFSVVQSKEAARPDRLLDADRINDLSTDIAAYAGFTRYFYDLGEGDAFNPVTLKQTIQKLRFSVCNQDVVWIHFSGYGRNDDETIYPALKMGGSEIYLRDIIAMLRTKKPKIILISIDSGNEKKPAKEFSNQVSDQSTEVQVSGSPLVRIVKPLVSNPIPREMGAYHQLENYGRLFKNFEGTKVIIFQSNSIGENAISNVVDGSYGLFCLEKCLREAINNKDVSADWMTIKENYVKYVSGKSKNRQNPKVTIEVPLDKCKENE